jgi:hypothetical protein
MAKIVFANRYFSHPWDPHYNPEYRSTGKTSGPQLPLAGVN